MKIALYLQNTINENRHNFLYTLDAVSKEDIDLLVFPENCWTPYNYELFDLHILNYEDSDSDETQIGAIVDQISICAGCPVLVCGYNRFEENYSVYSNLWAAENETRANSYVKCVATGSSALEVDEFYNYIPILFEPIKLKEYKIGRNICYDSTFPLFNRIYGLQDVDVIINMTGGHVDYKKWSYYQKVRAIENQCVTLCTMAYEDSNCKNSSYVFGYNKFGEKLSFITLGGHKAKWPPNEPDQVYVCDVAIPAMGDRGEPDEYLYQQETINKNPTIDFNPDLFSQLLKHMTCWEPDLYSLSYENLNLIFCVIYGMDIMMPELLQNMMYSQSISHLQNKRYIVLNRWTDLNPDFYNNFLSNVLKVRAAENFCAVVLDSPLLTKCIQVGNNKNAQLVKRQDGGFGIDLSRASGPEATWRNKQGPTMKAKWRTSYEYLLQYCTEMEART